MKTLRTAIFTIAAVLTLAASAQSTRRMAFNADGTFKIAQFTDIHWCDDSVEVCKRTLQSLQAVIDAERPDLNVLTGDIVTDHPALKGWKSIIAFFEKQNIPFVVAMGNHDGEFMSKDSIYTLLTDSPMYVGVKGNHVTGYGNMTIALHAGNGSDKVQNVIYLIDSNDYAANTIFGHYDWIHFDQIDWYRRESDRFAAKNGGKPVPSVAFFHIPLMETDHVVGLPDTFGNAKERFGKGINSGLFASMLEKGNMVGVFAGHDHMNDYVGIRSEVTLGFGRCSGWGAYGTLERGARIVQLREGSRHFDTWITTAKGREAVYHSPSGITSIEENAGYLAPVKASKVKNGVNYTYYEGEILSCDEIAHLKPLHKGVTDNFRIDLYDTNDHFAYTFDALFDAPEKAVYKFRLRSDDGAQLFIDGRLIIDNDGSHSANFVVGKVALEKGLHRIEIKYFEDYMGQELLLRFQTPDIDETPVTPAMLFIAK